VSKSQRTKGAAYEREVCDALFDLIPALTPKPKRNIGQARDGGNDITTMIAGIKFIIECKRRKTLGTVYQWLKQAEEACESIDERPIVIARQDQGGSIVIMTLEDFAHVINTLTRED
jgi:hypothetical protein